MTIQPWKIKKKYDNNFIFTFAVVKVRCGGITAAKIFTWKLSEVVIILFSAIRLLH